MLKIQILHNDQIITGNFQDLGKKQTTVWLDVESPNVTELAQIAAHAGVAPEELKELLEVNQRPILQDIGHFTAVVFHAPQMHEQEMRGAVRPHLLLASKEQKDLISIHFGSSAAISKFATYSLRKKIELFQHGCTALLFAVLAEMVDQGFEVLDRVDEKISELEEQIFDPALSRDVMKKIFHLKKDLIYLQRALSSDREVISEIEKAYGGFLDKKELTQFRLLYSDLTQLIELSATYRDIIISAIEVHLSAISNNLNVIMKKLTAWAAIILVPSLVAGVYGMNFRILPLSGHPYGFWYMLGLMFVSVWGLYTFFKRNDWI